MGKAKRLMAGSLLGIINFFATTLVSLFMMPFLISHLGNRMYGLWLLLGSFFGFYGLFDFGLGTAVQRYISRALGTDDHEEANRVFNTSLVAFTIIGLFALFISFGFAAFGQVFFKNPIELDLFRKIMIIIGFGLALGFPMRSFWALFSSHLRYDLSIYIDLARLIVRTLLIVFFLNRGYGLFAFALIMFLTDVGGYAANFFVSLKIARYIRFNRKYVSIAKIKHLFGYSVYSFISQVSTNIKFGIDNFVVAGFVGLGSVTLYSVASRLAGYFMQFMNNAVGLMTPVFSNYEASGNYEIIKEKFLFVTKINIYFSCLIGGIIIIMGEKFIQRWVGKDYTDAYAILLILAVPTMLMLMQSASGQVLYGISKHKFLAVINLAEAIANLALSLLLVKHYGLKGVALGTAIPMIFVKLFIQPNYVCKQIGLSLSQYMSLLFEGILKSITVLAVGYFICKSLILPQYLSLLIGSAILFLLFWSVIFLIGFSRQERGALLSIFLKKRNKNG